MIGVGLRHPHFSDAIKGSKSIDFVEVHSENFFACGGALPKILQDIADKYPVSLHSTAMGLASESGIPEYYLAKLCALAHRIKPFLISDHACFAWGKVGERFVHAGDLLPLSYNNASLTLMCKHIDQLQQRFGQRLLIENLSYYISLPGSTMLEKEFLTLLADRTGCGLLIDLNNILVNEFNASNSKDNQEILRASKQWLNDIPTDKVGEFHLAGFTLPKDNGIAVDDHSKTVSENCWNLYKHAIKKFGAKPTLIEWDNQLPEWKCLVKQADKARSIVEDILI